MVGRGAAAGDPVKRALSLANPHGGPALFWLGLQRLKKELR